MIIKLVDFNRPPTFFVYDIFLRFSNNSKSLFLQNPMKIENKAKIWPETRSLNLKAFAFLCPCMYEIILILDLRLQCSEAMYRMYPGAETVQVFFGDVKSF